MYCSGEFLFDGCNHVSSPIPAYVPRHPCRPSGAVGLFVLLRIHLVHAPLPRRPRYRLTLHDARVRTHQRFECISRRRKFIALRAHVVAPFPRACLFFCAPPRSHPTLLFIRNGCSFLSPNYCEELRNFAARHARANTIVSRSEKDVTKHFKRHRNLIKIMNIDKKQKKSY